MKLFKNFILVTETNTADKQIKQLKSKPTIDLIMWDRFFSKLYFCSKSEEMNIVTEFHILELLGFPSAKQTK